MVYPKEVCSKNVSYYDIDCVMKMGHHHEKYSETSASQVHPVKNEIFLWRICCK